MKLRFSVKVHDHYLLENDSTHWVGIGVRSGDEMLWVGQASIKICKVRSSKLNDTIEVLVLQDYHSFLFM